MNIDYEKDSLIDESALDVEWLRQTDLARRYGKYYAYLNKKVKQLQLKRKVIRSRLILEANKDPVNCCNKERPNAADIEAYYHSHPDYQSASEELIDLEEELEYADVAKNEITFTRKAALTNLVTLHGQMYFAGPSVPRDLKKEWDKHQNKDIADIKVRSVMKRRKNE